MQEPADDVAATLAAALARGEDVGGSLCVFGDWFGKPLDNWHRLVGVRVVEAALVLAFDEGEVLSVWEPRGLEVTPPGFVIRTATRVRWEWFSYGRPRTPENLRVQEHRPGDAPAVRLANWSD